MTVSSDALWKRCMEFFRQNVGERMYQTWFVPTQFKSFDKEKGELTILTPSTFFYEYLDEHYRKILHVAIYRFYGQGTILKYEVPVTREEHIQLKGNPEILPERCMNGLADEKILPVRELDSQLNVQLNFDNFIEGVSNKLPRSVGKAIAEHPDQQTFNPLFIYGHSGVGKTHLVNAIGIRFKQLYPHKRVLYLSAHLFQVQYTDSIRQNTFNDFMHFYQSIDMLIIDDIQELSGKATQYAFFHIFNHLHQNGRQIILTSDRPPVDLKGLEERMLTRFKWGLLAELEQPEESLRREILRSKVSNDGLKIPEDVISYISEHICDNVRELEGIVHSLLAYSIVYNKDVDLDFAKQILHRNTRKEKKNVTIAEIMESTCACCHVKREELIGKCRKATLVESRQLVIYLAQKHTGLTHSKIGAIVGNRNHATVIHSIKTISKRLETDKDLQEKLRMIEDNLNVAS